MTRATEAMPFPKVGQQWREKFKRQEYTERRTLLVMSIGVTEMSHQPGDPVEVTPIKISYKNGPEWRQAPRPISLYILRKFWAPV